MSPHSLKILRKTVKSTFSFAADWSVRTPVGKPTRPPPSLTTPSANKNFSRFKTVMIDELYSHFNRTVFDNKVEREREREILS